MIFKPLTSNTFWDFLNSIGMKQLRISLSKSNNKVSLIKNGDKCFSVGGIYSSNDPEERLKLIFNEISKIKYIVLVDCYCEHYLHEKKNYPRPGLVERKLTKDDIVTFVEKYTNFYGCYYRVEKDGITYDILPHNLKQI